MASLFIDCTDDLRPLWDRILRPGDPAVGVNMANGQPADLPALVRGIGTIIVDHTYMDDALLARCPDLRHIVYLGTGASSYIAIEAAQARGITVHTIRGYGDTTVAEHTLALVLASAREVARMDREVRQGVWRQYEGIELLGKTLGIIGLGGIGRELARLAHGIGMNVLAWNRTPPVAPTVPMASLDDVLSKSDVLCVCLGLNAGTRGFVSRERLLRTKPGVVVVNTARAEVVDNRALADLLDSGHVRHAAMDVFAPEPPAADDPFLAMHNVTLTAHAGSMTPEATLTLLRRAFDLAVAHDT